MALLHVPNDGAEQRKISNHVEVEDSRAKPVIEIVVQVGDLIRRIGNLRFQASLGKQFWKLNRMLPMAAVLQDTLASFVA